MRQFAESCDNEQIDGINRDLGTPGIAAFCGILRRTWLWHCSQFAWAGMMATMKPTLKPAATGMTTRSQLTHSIGTAVSRFQDFSSAFDDVAAEILALDRRDLSCMTMLLFGGAASAEELAGALQVRRGIVTTTLERLQLAGYARFQPGNGTRIELTEHARKWIERIWAPLQARGRPPAEHLFDAATDSSREVPAAGM